MIRIQNKTKRTLTILFTLAFLVGIAFFVFYMIILVNLEQARLYPVNSSYQDTGDYKINSETVLDDLDQGNTNVFMPITATPEVGSMPTLSVGLYTWSQSDYLKVAEALNQFVWKDDLKGWYLYSMYFYRGCQDNPAGFDAGEITYFKTFHGPFQYTARVVDIYPIGEAVSWGGNAIFPRPLHGWEYIDLQKLEITADEALKIAEEKEGQRFRLKVKNACTIDVFINPNPNQEISWKWHVFYNTNSLGVLLIQIDSGTGKAEIIRSD